MLLGTTTSERYLMHAGDRETERERERERESAKPLLSYCKKKIYLPTESHIKLNHINAKGGLPAIICLPHY